MKFNTKIFENNTVKIAAIAVVVFLLIFGIVSGTRNCGGNNTASLKRNTITEEAAKKELNRLYGNLRVNNLTPRKDPDFTEDELFTVLPDISEYPFVVNPTTADFLTIYSSTEKAGYDYAGWLVDVAEKFNQSGFTADGVPVSVGVRAIPSGLGADFISSGKYTPDIFAPANELWGDMIIDKGAQANLIEERLAGNVAGIVLSGKKNDELTKKYGPLNVNVIINSILNGEISVGYTNPLSSSDGLNFLLSALYSFDGSNPVGEASGAQHRNFQDRISYVSYDPAQLRDSAQLGTLDGFVSDYQSYVNMPQMKSSHVFIPFGVRHDQPVYEIGELTQVKKQMTAMFIDFCKTPESQAMATEKGFNALEDYISELPQTEGSLITTAQEMWKKEKSGTSDLTAVFVADISGSMEGSPLLKLKASLNRAATFIDSNTNIGLVTFSETVNIALPIGKFDINQRTYFSGAVKSMQAGGPTAMFDAIVAAEKMLIDAQTLNPNTKLMLFVLTDGETNRGYEFSDVEKIIRGLRTPVYTIGYNANIDVLKDVSDINEAVTMNADTDDVIYKLQSLFNAQM